MLPVSYTNTPKPASLSYTFSAITSTNKRKIDDGHEQLNERASETVTASATRTTILWDLWNASPQTFNNVGDQACLVPSLSTFTSDHHLMLGSMLL